MSSKENNTHHYNPLSSERSVRILTLNPATKLEHPIAISLRQESLSTARYVALSYVWGSPQGDRPITCDGGTLLVTENCELALRYLRRREETVDLWIDAICIDQSSVGEKQVQVPLMGEIYSNATETLVWLGVGNPELGPVIKKLDRLVKFLVPYSPYPDPSAMGRWFEKFIRRKTFGELLNPSEDLASVAKTILEHPWWKRSWTMQEEWLSRKITFVLGDGRITYNQPPRWYVILTRASVPVERLVDWLVILARDQIDPLALANFFWRSRCYLAFHILSRMWARSARPFLSGQITFLMRLNQATNPRDRVYSALGILSKADKSFASFPVDYSKSTSAVWTDFSWFFLRTFRRLDLLVCIEPPEDESSTTPSWVLPLDDTPSFDEVDMVQWALKMTASRGSLAPAQLEYDIAPKTIRLAGVVLAKIYAVSIIRLPFENPESEYENQLKELRQKTPGYFKFTEGSVVAPLRIIDKVQDGQDGTLLVNWVVNTVVYVCGEGHVGRSKFDVRAGDKVVLLAGGQTPFVLRSMGYGRYRFLGRTYVTDCHRKHKAGILVGEDWRTRNYDGMEWFEIE